MTATLWWIIGFVLLAAEMLTGTFYLLILGCAALITGAAAYFGLPQTGQWLVAALAAAGGSLAVNRMRALRIPRPNPTQDLDIGQPVALLGRHGGEWRVRYRGTEWQADLIESQTAPPETLYIHAKLGNRLIVAAQPPQP